MSSRRDDIESVGPLNTLRATARWKTTTPPGRARRRDGACAGELATAGANKPVSSPRITRREYKPAVLFPGRAGRVPGNPENSTESPRPSAKKSGDTGD